MFTLVRHEPVSMLETTPTMLDFAGHNCTSRQAPRGRGDQMLEKRSDRQAYFDVRGRTAVITGGSGQFGRAMAAALAQAGAQVAVLGRHA
jgi:hypothetical protein